MDKGRGEKYRKPIPDGDRKLRSWVHGVGVGVHSSAEAQVGLVSGSQRAQHKDPPCSRPGFPHFPPSHCLFPSV